MVVVVCAVVAVVCAVVAEVCSVGAGSRAAELLIQYLTLNAHSNASGQVSRPTSEAHMLLCMLL